MPPSSIRPVLAPDSFVFFFFFLQRGSIYLSMLHGSFVKCVSLNMPPPEAVSSWHRAQRHLTFCAVHRCFTCFPARLHKAHLLLEAVSSAPKYSGKHCSSSTFTEVAAFANSHTSASLKAFWVSGVLPCSFASCWWKIKVSPRQCPGNGKKKMFCTI